MAHLVSGLIFLKNFANLLMMSPCRCHLIFLLAYQFIIVIITTTTTFTMHHTISVLLQTQNLAYLFHKSFLP